MLKLAEIKMEKCTSEKLYLMRLFKPIVLCWAMVFMGVSLLSACRQTAKPKKIEMITIGVTGDNFNWKFRYPGLDTVLGTDDDYYSTQNLFLPEHSEVTLKIESQDFLYSFALPEKDLRQIAVPGLTYELNFSSGPATELQLLGDQFCGFSHETLKGSVYVLNQDGAFYSWVKQDKLS